MNKRQRKKVPCPHGYYKEFKRFSRTHIVRHIPVKRIRARSKWLWKTINSEFKKARDLIINDNVGSELSYCEQKIEEKQKC